MCVVPSIHFLPQVWRQHLACHLDCRLRCADRFPPAGDPHRHSCVVSAAVTAACCVRLLHLGSRVSQLASLNTFDEAQRSSSCIAYCLHTPRALNKLFVQVAGQPLPAQRQGQPAPGGAACGMVSAMQLPTLSISRPCGLPC